MRGQLRTIGYTLRGAAGADQVLSLDEALELSSPWGRAKLVPRQVGRFNLSNVLGVIGCLVAYGASFPQAMALVAELPPVPGRMFRDYKHRGEVFAEAVRSLK